MMRKLRLFKKLLILSALLLLSLLAGACFYLNSDAFSHRAKSWTITQLELRFALEAEIDSVRLRLWGLAFEVEGFRLFEAGRRWDGPAVEVERVRADFPVTLLLSSGLVLDGLELDGPVFHLRRQESGRLNLAEMFSRDSDGQPSVVPPVEIGALSILNGLLRYNQRDIPLNISRFGFRGEVHSTSQSGEYSGGLVLDGFELQTGQINLPPSRIEVQFQADSRQVKHLKASLTCQGLELALNGRVTDLEDLRYDLDFQARGDFEAIRSQGFLTAVQQALFESQGRLSGQGRDFHYQGRFQASKVSALGLLFESLEARIELTPQQAEFVDLKARLGRSELHSRGVVGFGSQMESRMDVEFRDFDWSGYIPFLDGQATMQAHLSWPGLEWEKMQGGGQLSYRAVARLDQLGSGLQEALPLQGGSSLRVSGGSVQLPDARAVGESAQIDFQAQLDWEDWKYSVAFKARQDNAQPLLTALLEEIGESVPQAVRQGLSLQGGLLASGRLSGKKSVYQLSGRLDECRLDWEGQPLGQFQSAFRLSEGALQLEESRLDGKGLSLGASQASISFDPPDASAVGLEARFDSFPLDRLHSLLPELAADDIQPQGRLSGLLRATRQEGQDWRLEGDLRVDEPKMWGQGMDSLQAQLAADKSTVQLRDVRGSIGPGLLNASLQIDLKRRRWQGTAQGQKIPLQAIAALQERLSLQGQADVQLGVEGSWDDPQFEVEVTSEDLAYGRSSLKEVRLTAKGDSQGLRFQARHRLFGSRLESKGELQLAAPWDLQAELTLEEVPLSPYLALLGLERLSAVDGRASGKVTLNGPLLDPQSFSAQAALDQVTLETAGYKLENQGPLTAHWEKGKVTIDPFRISGPESSLQLSGHVRLTEPPSLQMHLEGHSNLRILNDLIPSGDTWGEVELSVIVSGTLDSPRMVGSAEVQRAFLFNPALPTPLVDASGSFKFSPSLISIDRFAASTSYGKVQALGSVFLDGFEPQRWKINLFGSGLKVEFPSEVHSTVDADLDLLKSDSGQLVTGTVTVHSSEYRKPVTWTDLFSRYMGRRQDALYQGPGGDVALDVSVQGLRALHIRNNLADLQASASLNLRGTLSSPVILGSLQVDEGKLFLEDNQYDINRGTINFNDPRRTTPHLNFEAETSVRDFVITVSVQGTLDRPKIRFRSDPPLPSGDIVSLLAVGETMNGLRGPSNSASNGTVGMAAASRVLSRALQDSLEGQTSRLFGLQKFSVDPFLAGTGRGPGARITIGRQLGKNLAVTYITDLGSENSGQIVIVEVQLQSWLTAVGTREEDGSLAIDFKLKKRF